MPEFRFYGSMEDRERILEGLFDLGFRVIPDRSYREQVPAEFGRMSQELEQAIVNNVVYVCGPFTTRPPAMSPIESGQYKGTYVIEATLKRGGPLLRLALPSCKAVGERIKIGPGSLFHPPEYWNDAVTVRRPPSKELREGYQRVKKVIMEHTLPRKVSVNIRIGRDALGFFENGSADILVNGKWLSKANKAANG